jgi:butyrate kinase
MVYQVTMEIGAMVAALNGRMDVILLAGGMARSEKLTGEWRSAIAWIAAVVVYPGEDELQAVGEGALRVLRGEKARVLAAEELAPQHA